MTSSSISASSSTSAAVGVAEQSSVQDDDELLGRIWSVMLGVYSNIPIEEAERSYQSFKALLKTNPSLTEERFLVILEKKLTEFRNNQNKLVPSDHKQLEDNAHSQVQAFDQFIRDQLAIPEVGVPRGYLAIWQEIIAVHKLDDFLAPKGVSIPKKLLERASQIPWPSERVKTAQQLLHDLRQCRRSSHSNDLKIQIKMRIAMCTALLYGR